MEERIEELIEAVDKFYGENGDKDRAHTHRVWLIAKTIAEEEGLSEDKRDIVEKAAVLHDVACPLCRSLYGKAEGRMQEVHSREVIEPILSILGWSNGTKETLIAMASRHHTYSPSDPVEDVILKEADALVNLTEAESFDVNQAIWFGANVFRTKTGKFLLEKLIRANLEEGEEI